MSGSNFAPFARKGSLARYTEERTKVTATMFLDTEQMAGWSITGAEIHGDGQFITLVFSKDAEDSEIPTRG